MSKIYHYNNQSFTVTKDDEMVFGIELRDYTETYVAMQTKDGRRFEVMVDGDFLLNLQSWLNSRFRNFDIKYTDFCD